MNNFVYPVSNNYYQMLFEELKKIDLTLQRIEKKLSEHDIKKENKYLEKDDNYYMI